MRRRGRREGFVLVSVLMLSVVFISCATAFTWFARLQARSALRERTALSNRSAAQVLSTGMMKLISAISEKSDADSPLQPWFQPFVLQLGPSGFWTVQARPLDDKIPVRGLFLPDRSTVRTELRRPWEDLWERLGQRELAALTLDFMDKDSRPRVGGAERDNFINRQPLDLSEFLLLPEVTPELLHSRQGRPGLADYCTLWSDGKLNLNVAPVEVLGLLPGMDRNQAERLVAFCRNGILKNMSDVRGIPGFSPKAATHMLNLAGFKSRYFALRIEFVDESGGGAVFNIVFDKQKACIVRWEEI
ncbi:MAG: general secretion pathway protein GspK [Fretibacterium sp.]|nr:general secretion pathway protein GspK [Fretibacterium sp.]